MAAHIKANWVHASDTNEFINLNGYVQKVCKLNSATKKYTTTFYNSYQVDTSQENDAKLYPRLKKYKGYSLLVYYYEKSKYVRRDYWALKRFTKDTLFLGKDGKDIYIRKSLQANNQAQIRSVQHREPYSPLDGMNMDSMRRCNDSLRITEYIRLMQGDWKDSEGELIFHMHINKNTIERYLTSPSPVIDPGAPDTAMFTISRTECACKPDNYSGLGYYLHTMSNNRFTGNNCYLILSIDDSRMSLYYGDTVPTRHDIRRYYVYKRVNK